MIQYHNPHFLISTFFGVGKISKKMPGTIGSIFAFPLSYLILKLSRNIQNLLNVESIVNLYIAYFAIPLIIIVLLFFIGVYCSHHYSILINKKDSSEIIIDEVVGQSLSIIVTIPITFFLLYNIKMITGATLYYDIVLVSAVLGNFILFRIFDIFKPWPIGLCDKKIGGGWGIMLDDILAAVFTIVTYFALLIVVVS